MAMFNTGRLVLGIALIATLTPTAASAQGVGAAIDAHIGAPDVDASAQPIASEFFVLPDTAKLRAEELSTRERYLVENGIRVQYEFGSGESKALSLQSESLGEISGLRNAKIDKKSVLAQLGVLLANHYEVLGGIEGYDWVIDKVRRTKRNSVIWFHQEIDGVPVLRSRLFVELNGVADDLEIAFVSPEESITDTRSWIPPHTLIDIAIQATSPRNPVAHSALSESSYEFLIDAKTKDIRPVFKTHIEGSEIHIDAVSGEVLLRQRQGDYAEECHRAGQCDS